MKMNRKGFMLAEVVVVAVVIATVLVTLFSGLNNVSSAYETRNKYYDVDSLFVAMEINDIIVRNNMVNSLEERSVTLASELSNDVSNFISFYSANIKYDISSSYFVPYNKEQYDLLKTYEINQTFKDYLSYLDGNIDFTDDYDYMIIVERANIEDANDCYYYALKLNY